MGTVLSTFCFDSDEIKLEKEIRRLNLNDSSKNFEKKPRSKPKKKSNTSLSDINQSSSQTIESLNDELMKRLESIKDIEDDLLEKKESSTNKKPDEFEGSFSLIIKKKKDTKTKPITQQNDETDLKFEYIGNDDEDDDSEEFENTNDEIDMDDMMDFIPLKSSLPITNNNSLMNDGKYVLSAIKETSENSDASYSKNELVSSRNSSKILENQSERNMKEQLKEIEELNLLEVIDSFEVTEEEEEEEKQLKKNDKDNEEKEQEKEKNKMSKIIVKREKGFLEDNGKNNNNPVEKNDVEIGYNFSERAKNMAMKLQRKSLKARSKNVKNNIKNKKKNDNILKRKSARLSAQNEIKNLINKIKTENQENIKNDKNTYTLNPTYKLNDSYKRKSRILLNNMTKKISRTVSEESIRHRDLISQVEIFYSDLISSNLEKLKN